MTLVELRMQQYDLVEAGLERLGRSDISLHMELSLGHDGLR